MNVDNGPCIDFCVYFADDFDPEPIVAHEGPGYLYLTPVSGGVFVGVSLSCKSASGPDIRYKASQLSNVDSEVNRWDAFRFERLAAGVNAARHVCDLSTTARGQACDS